ncbi:MAG: nitroreductase family protein [Bacteroidales bacterium]|nr:nitroreductase family protein [Bacteroidales bacterium]
MKKILIMTLVLLLAAGGLQAQKKDPRKRIPSSAVNTKDLNVSDKAASGLDIRQLPPPAKGMEAPLFAALQQRRTIRELREEEIPPEMVSSLLWSAYGFNRPGEKRRVVPSAVNVQEFDIYLFTHEGVFKYDALTNTLETVLRGDHRGIISKQKHFVVAPVAVVIVANYDRMEVFKDTETRDFYAAVDCGYVSQNIYLFCASAKLGTVACGAIERDAIHKLLNIKNGRALLAHPVGLPMQ